MEKKQFVIIGAGISGLIAAYELEKEGISPIVLEATDRVGGRVKTDLFQEYRLDHGFQVLLTSYPEARRYLDYSKLDLKYFHPGAKIYNGNISYVITDPLRNIGGLLPMITSQVGSIGDKVKVGLLSVRLKNDSVEDIFTRPSTDTLTYLRKQGFSERIIDNFFRPFFAGIFLEKNMETSSRMFEFVFKMFSEGNAAIPANGMEEIPKQLKSNLSGTEFRFNQRVENIEGRHIHLSSGNSIEADKIIVATMNTSFIPGLNYVDTHFRKVTNLYFEAENSFIKKPLIGLNARKTDLVNNFNFMTDVSSNYGPSGKHLLSVSIIDVAKPMTKTVIDKVKQEIIELSDGSCGNLTFLKSYEINYALPIVDDLVYRIEPTTTRLTKEIFLAGDHMLYGSLNAAMTSGRLAAEGAMRN